jgi:hypothetical protein
MYGPRLEKFLRHGGGEISGGIKRYRRAIYIDPPTRAALKAATVSMRL